MKYSLNYTFERDNLSCGNCPFFTYDGDMYAEFGHCSITYTDRFDIKDHVFHEELERFNDCPLTEVDA